MSILGQDVRYGARMLAAGGPVTLMAVITLALGIGANTAIFSIVNGILLEPLPFERPGELLLIGERHGDRGISVSWLNYIDYRAQARTIADMGASVTTFLNLTRGSEEPERLVGARVTRSYFSTLGVPPLLGRLFTEREDAPGGDPVVVLSAGAWRRLYGGDRAVLGRAMSLNGTAYTVVGVMPASFVIQNPPIEAWVSMGRVGETFGDRGNHPGISVVARMKPGVTVEHARTDLDAIAARLAEDHPATNRNIGVRVGMLHDVFVGQDLKRALLVLLGAVAFVLLIACANVANLLLSRGAARQREIAVRTALGAGRWRVLRQLLTESVLLALAGGAAGLVLGAWGLRALLGAVPDNLARVDAVRIDAPVFVFTAALTLLTAIVFGLAPALQVSKPDLTETLKEGGRTGTKGTRAQRVRSTLTVLQIALSMVLLAGAGLMLRSFAALQAASPGVDPAGVVAAGVTLPGQRYATDLEARRQFFRRVMERLQATPGIDGAGAVMPLPLSLNGWQTSFLVEGQPEPEPGKFPTNDIARVSPHYFQTMGIRLLRGRPFSWHDDESAPPVAIVDETFVRAWFPDQDPIGKRVKVNAGHVPPGMPEPPWTTIVGVVNHVKNYGIDQESRVEIYVPFLQSTLTQINLVVKTRGDAALAVRAIRDAVREADPSLPVFGVRTMDEYLARTLTSKRLLMMVLGVFALVALTLAAVGIYGVMSYAVAQRTSEIGIRMALGAHPRDVLGLVVGQGLLLTIAGLVLGLGAAWWLTRLLATLLFGVSTSDPATFAGVALLLGLVASIATWVPARRAARVDPLVALRYE